MGRPRKYAEDTVVVSVRMPVTVRDALAEAGGSVSEAAVAAIVVGLAAQHEPGRVVGPRAEVVRAVREANAPSTSNPTRVGAPGKVHQQGCTCLMCKS